MKFLQKILLVFFQADRFKIATPVLSYHLKKILEFHAFNYYQ